MKIDKEYSATHSMATAWYCVDEEGNVGIFDIEDNGPIPQGCEEDREVNEMFWHDFASEGKDSFREMNLSIEQITPMLKSIEVPDKWEEHNSYGEYWVWNGSWSEVIIKIDMANLPILEQAASLDKDCDIICLSRKEGCFFVNFANNREGVKMLEEKHVVLEKYMAPHYDEILPIETLTPYDKLPDVQEEENNSFPIFIYDVEYNPEDGPAKRMSNPAYPMKIQQLPKDIREKITHLPLKFKDTEHLQLAEHLPVYISCARCKEVGNERWWQICSSKGEIVYYGEKSNKILSEKELDKIGNKI